MSSGRHSFRLNDFSRAAKAAIAVGLAVDRVEVRKDGTISVVIRQDAERPAAKSSNGPASVPSAAKC